MVITVSHLLSSIETRPAAKAYKLSTRIESLVIEGASVEYSLIPIITSENVLNGKSSFLLVPTPNQETGMSFWMPPLQPLEFHLRSLESDRDCLNRGSRVLLRPESLLS